MNSPPRFRCEKCNTDYSLGGDLLRHLHTDKRHTSSIPCGFPDCFKQYQRAYNLKKHLKEKHQVSNVSTMELEMYRPLSKKQKANQQVNGGFLDHGTGNTFYNSPHYIHNQMIRRFEFPTQAQQLGAQFSTLGDPAFGPTPTASHTSPHLGLDIPPFNSTSSNTVHVASELPYSDLGYHQASAVPSDITGNVWNQEYMLSGESMQASYYETDDACECSLYGHGTDIADNAQNGRFDLI